MVFNVEPNEAAFIVRVIGQLPTETGALPVYQKLVEQYQEQETQNAVVVPEKTPE
jgi:hypothetical protein